MSPNEKLLYECVDQTINDLVAMANYYDGNLSHLQEFIDQIMGRHFAAIEAVKNTAPHVIDPVLLARASITVIHATADCPLFQDGVDLIGPGHNCPGCAIEPYNKVGEL